MCAKRARRDYRTLWLSDIHLGFKDCKAEYLIELLEQVECETLYLVGDIVDLWSMQKRFCWPNSHYQVLRLIVDKAQNGTRVVYLPGNHDIAMEEYVGHLFAGVEVEREWVHTTAAGLKLLVFHGDVLDGHIILGRLDRIIGDGAYDLLLFLNRWCNRLRKLFGLPYWSLASYIKERVKNAQRAIETYQRAAVAEAKRRGLDGVVCGHIHRAAIAHYDGLIYCNDGDWVESCTALVESAEGELKLLDWSAQRRQQASVTLVTDDEIERAA